MGKYGVCLSVFLSVTLRFAGALFVRGGHFWTRIASRFMGRFWLFSPFSEGIALSDTVESSHFRRHNFCQIAVKNCDKSKNQRKRLCAPLRIDSWEIWRKYHSSSLGPRTQMCTCIIFSARCYIVLAAIVKIRIGSPKTARNEQVFAHQKPYRK